MSKSWYEIRVELHEPHHAEDVYKKLHEKMDAAGFQTTVESSVGVEYKMPRATYLKLGTVGQSDAICNQVMTIAESVAAKGHAGVVVAEYGKLSFKGLKKVEKASLASQIKATPTKVPASAQPSATKVLFSQYRAQQEKK